MECSRVQRMESRYRTTLPQQRKGWRRGDDLGVKGDGKRRRAPGKLLRRLTLAVVVQKGERRRSEAGEKDDEATPWCRYWRMVRGG